MEVFGIQINCQKLFEFADALKVMKGFGWGVGGGGGVGAFYCSALSIALATPPRHLLGCCSFIIILCIAG